MKNEMKRNLLLGFSLLLTSFGYAQFTAVPDDNFEQALIDQGIDTNPVRDDQVLTSAISGLTFLNLTGDDNLNFNENEIGLNIQSLVGIKGFTSLETLWVQGNALTDMDLAGMSSLKDVRAFFNDLQTININGLTNLEIIGLNQNNITSILVNTNTSLQQFDIEGNSLSTLNVSGLNALTGMNVANNPNLNCILVDDAATAAAFNADANFVKNGSTTFDENCVANYTAIPDDNFEQYLIDQGIDSEGILNDKVLTTDITNVTVLELGNLNISSLAGIEDFISLQRLNAIGNQITSLNISQNSALTFIGLQDNSLSNLNVTQNSELTNLDVARNIGMTSIDLSQNSKLETFNGFLCSFQSLDITQNTLLRALGMSDNQLSTIDLSQNDFLEVIFLDNNNLTGLDISNLPVNQVTKLYTCNNNLSCIAVSDVAAANSKTSGNCPVRPNQPDGWHKDVATTYNLNCDITEKIVEVSVLSNQMLDTNNVYTVVSANEPMNIGFNLQDENGNELDAGVLPNYALNITTVAATNQNPAQGGNVSTPGIDFELLTNDPIQVNTANNSSDGNRTIAMNGDQLFEADEYFFIEVSTNDPNITLKNAENGVVTIPVKIVDNEITNVNLELIDNGIEGSQNVKVRINSTLVNNTGADMPFTIALQNGSATEGADFELNNTTVQLPNGQSFVDVDITVLPDQDATEGTEDFLAMVSYAGVIDPSRVNIMNGTVTATIADDTTTNNGSFGIVSSLTNAGQGPYYEVNEGDNFSLNLDADASANEGETFTVSVDYAVYSVTEVENLIFGDGIQDDPDEPIGSETVIERDKQSVGDITPETESVRYTFAIDKNKIDGIIDFSVVDDLLNEETEEVVITINVESENVALNNTAVYILKIKANDPIEINAFIENAGNLGNYSISEGSGFNLVLHPSDVSDAQFNFDLNVDQSTADLGFSRDFEYYLDDLDENFDRTIASFTVPEDLSEIKIPFIVYLDELPNEAEEIVITLPKPDGNYIYEDADESGGLSFTIPIKDSNPYFVDVEIDTEVINNGISEGDNFEITFIPLNIPTDLVRPVLFDVDLGFDTGTDFAEVNVDFEVKDVPKLNFDFSTSINIQSVIDGIEETDDETIRIRLPKPNGPYQWSNADGNGDLIFDIKLKDRDNEEAIADYMITFSKEDGTTFQDSPIAISESDVLNFSLKSANNSNVEKGFLVTPRDGTATANEKDFFSVNYKLEGPQLFENSAFIDLNFEDSNSDEEVENFFLDITPTTKNYNLITPDGNRIDFGETFTVEVQIENAIEPPPLNQDSQFITDFVGNANRISRTSSAFSQEFTAIEGDTIEVFLGTLKPNNRQGETYIISYGIGRGNNFNENDYELKIENTNGDDLIQAGGFLFEVDNDADYNAKVSIILKEDMIEETTEKFFLRFLPKILVTPPDEGENGPTGFSEIAGFQSVATKGADLAFDFFISDTPNQEIVYAVLSNSGGIEGQTDNPDIITCTLVDGENKPFTGHTSEIRIELKDEIDERDNLKINPWEYSLDKNIFTFPPGISTATISATYFDERISENGDLDIENTVCNYYNIKIYDILENAGLNIIFDEDWKTIKVIDKYEYLVFVDLILNENVRAVPFNELEDSSYFSSVCSGGCINYYEVEEGGTLEFQIDAANGVTELYKYILDLDFDGKPFRFNKDVSLPEIGDKTKGIEITVNKKEVDRTIEVKVEDDNEDDSDEQFSIRFAEPTNAKTYRFSKRDSRSYGDNFKFRTIDAVPLSISVINNSNIIYEEDENSYGEVLLKLDRKTPTSLRVPFELTGSDARFGAGEGGDYTIKSLNKIEVRGNKGVIHVNSNQQFVKFEIIPKDDSLDEGDESIQFTLKDDFGYSLGSPFTELVIKDDDETGLPISIVSDENIEIFENPNKKTSEIITFMLGDDKVAPSDLRVDFSLDPFNTDATINEDFELYEVLDNGSERAITTSDEFYLTIPSQGTTAQLRIVAVADNDNSEEEEINEGDEKVEVVLEASDQYSAEGQKSVTINIRDDSDAPENPLDTKGIVAQVISSSCPDTNSGRIGMKNGTDFSYRASLYLDDDLIGNPATLAANTLNFSNLFESLKAGNYTIYLSYDLNEGEERPKAELPSFTLTIKDSKEVALIKSTTSKEFKVVDLEVSGSLSYFVENNGKKYEYNVNTTNRVEIEVPLQFGDNKISIQGDSECQGILKASIRLDNIIPYPNPTTDTIYVAGFEPNSELKIQVFDVNGRIISNKSIISTSSTIAIPLHVYARGTYLCKILHNDGSSSNFKIVKK